MRCACDAKVEVRPSTVEEMREHGSALFRAHFKEIATNQDSTTLDPAWHLYEQLEAAGTMFVLAAWSGKKLIGYSANILMPEHLHSRDLRYVQNDALFVAEEFRLASAGGKLMRATKAAAKQRGASLIMWCCRPGTALHRILDQREGCIVQDITYSEPL